MLFNSYPFLLFCGLTFLIFYFPLFAPYQTSILILSSLFFYAYDQPYLLILLILSASISSLCSFIVLRSKTKRAQVWWSALGVATNISILAFFKYNRLFVDIFTPAALNGNGLFHLFITLPLPIGISFYTFHGISLLVDVLRSDKSQSFFSTRADVNLRSHFWQTLLYLTFFPQLIAGPITKANYFYPQIKRKFFSQIDWLYASKALITGFFLKTVVADNLQDTTFWLKYPYFMHSSSIELLAYLFGYSMQIFADFAGYSLIAIGLAALFGYRLPQNFDFPYISQTFSEFWRRWHITLSNWLRDYLYFPLGGNRAGRTRTYLNLFIVMFLGGLWHGAAISYAVWGTWHGVALAIERIFRKSRFYTSESKAVSACRWATTFAFVSFAWLFFKLTNFEHVLLYLSQIGSNFLIMPSPIMVLSIFLFSLPVIAYHAIYLVRDRYSLALDRAQPILYGAMAALIILNHGTSNGFIYFQF